uniref:Uncharacterized protein n=1 Tax=Ignisphaera aggregans TaxID=334771 RepID=A0A7C4BAS9_9CREN
MTGPSGFEPRVAGASGDRRPRIPAYQVHRGSEDLAKSCLGFLGLVKVQEALATRASVPKIIVENNMLVLEFNNPDKLLNFVELLKLLGN